MRRRDFMTSAAMLLGTVTLPGAGGLLANDRAAALDAAAFHKARRFAATRFGRIAYVERGQGDAALFLHGFPLNGFQWRGAIERLAHRRRCLAPDFLGLGYSEVAAGQSVSPEAQTEMLAAFLDVLGVGKVDLVASDSGGAIAQLFLVRYPERVRTLLLANCDAENDCPPPALLPIFALAREGKWADQWLVPWKADTKLARSAEGIGGMCYTDPRHPTDEAIETYFAPLVASAEAKAWVHAYVLALDRNPLAGIAAQLRRSKVPARVVWGMADDIFSKASPDYLAGVFGASRGVRKLEGRKLFWPEELPEVVAEEAEKLWGA